jgi:hypothetical protein
MASDIEDQANALIREVNYMIENVSPPLLAPRIMLLCGEYRPAVFMSALVKLVGQIREARKVLQ